LLFKLIERVREGKREIKLRTRFDSDLHLTRLKKIKESSEASQLTGEKDTFGGGDRGGSAKFNYLATDAPLLNLKKRKRKMAVRVVKRKKKGRRGGHEAPR
jgi:hypothetical protein